MQKPKILIVDDETEVRKVIKDFLNQRIKCDIREAENGKRALEILQKETVDLALLDIKMPGISGVDVLKEAKQIQPQTDILILSAWDSQMIAVDTLKEGAEDYIIKSSPIAVIYDKICTVIKKRGRFLPKEPDKK